ncbi:MAG: cytochrome c [Novosphingobium sp.]
MKIWKFAFIASAALSTSIMAAAVVNPVFQQRQDNFKGLGKAMKGVMDEFKKPAPDMAVIKANANVLAASASKVARQFPKGTGPEAGVKADALPAIWEKPADFKLAASRLVAATRDFKSASATGDIAKVRVAMGAVGQACKGCHDNFRKPRS